MRARCSAGIRYLKFQRSTLGSEVPCIGMVRSTNLPSVSGADGLPSTRPPAAGENRFPNIHTPSSRATINPTATIPTWDKLNQRAPGLRPEPLPGPPAPVGSGAGGLSLVTASNSPCHRALLARRKPTQNQSVAMARRALVTSAESQMDMATLRPCSTHVASPTSRHANVKGSAFRFQAGSALTETEAVSEACGIVPVHWPAACRTRSNQRPTQSLIWPAVTAPGCTGVRCTVCNFPCCRKETERKLLRAYFTTQGVVHIWNWPTLRSSMSLRGIVILDRKRVVKMRFSPSSSSSPLQVKMRAEVHGKQSRIRAGVLK